MESSGSLEEWIFVITYVSFLLVVAGCVVFFSSRKS